MSRQHPVVTLTPREGARLREVLKEIGADAARHALGNIDAGTLFKAASEVPIARLTAEVIRGKLDRI